MYRALLALLVTAAGCAADGAPEPDCRGDRCESSADRDQLVAELEGFGDPVSAFLRQAAAADGSIPGDYRAVLDAVGADLGCGADTEASFVVLSNEALIPKTVFTRCSADPQAASRFFLALPAVGADRDVEPRLLHISAWDEAAARYRRFATFPDEAGGMRVNVEPSFCLDCHGGPEELGSWQPLMNVMESPWSQWNAEPGFASHVFDDYLDPEIAAGPVYQEITAPSVLASAADLEPIVRAGIDRFVGARVQRRAGAADLETALDLARPLFCDETVNFVSEVHESGELRTSAAVDDALRQLLLGAGAEGEKLAAESLRLAPVGPGEQNLTMVAVRGESTLQAELALVSRRAIPLELALRVRALDWTRPAASPFRCQLFHAGAARLRAGARADELAAATTTEELLPVVIDEALHLDTDAGLVALSPPAGADLLAVADARAAADALAAGDVDDFAATVAELGDAVDAYLAGIDRTTLDAARRERACAAAARHLITPIFPDVDCP